MCVSTTAGILSPQLPQKEVKLRLSKPTCKISFKKRWAFLCSPLCRKTKDIKMAHLFVLRFFCFLLILYPMLPCPLLLLVPRRVGRFLNNTRMLRCREPRRRSSKMAYRVHFGKIQRGRIVGKLFAPVLAVLGRYLNSTTGLYS